MSKEWWLVAMGNAKFSMLNEINAEVRQWTRAIDH
jgi:hypothetical protein